jgi:Ca2+-transporting ATPase
MSTKKTLINFIPTGLSEKEVEKSRAEHGQNVLTPPRKTSTWKLYLEKFNDPMIRILLIAATISLLLAFIENDFLETVGIFIAIFLATTVGFVFELDADRKFNILNALGEEQPVKVRRGGETMEIPRKDVDVGDVVYVEVGDEVPADGTLYESVDLQIDE